MSSSLLNVDVWAQRETEFVQSDEYAHARNLPLVTAPTINPQWSKWKCEIVNKCMFKKTLSFFHRPIFVFNSSRTNKRTLVFNPKKKKTYLERHKEYFEEQTNTFCLKTDTFVTDIDHYFMPHFARPKPHSCSLRPLVIFIPFS